MRRLIYLLLLVLFVSASATCVNASTDCERWFVAYRRELAHTHALQRIAAAKRRAKLYTQRKLAGYVAPKPRLVPAKAPRMTRKQTLHHFELACGVLPEDEADGPEIAGETPPPFHSERPLDELDTLPNGFNDMIASNDVPPPPPGSGSYPDYPDGGPPVYTPNFGGPGGGAPGGGGPGTGTTVPPGSPPTTPGGPAVPEPSSYVLMLTGMFGVAGAFRQRFKS
jgi:PEP-CTERM motif-containing protein